MEASLELSGVSGLLRSRGRESMDGARLVRALLPRTLVELGEEIIGSQVLDLRALGPPAVYIFGVIFTSG